MRAFFAIISLMFVFVTPSADASKDCSSSGGICGTDSVCAYDVKSGAHRCVPTKVVSPQPEDSCAWQPITVVCNAAELVYPDEYQACKQYYSQYRQWRAERAAPQSVSPDCTRLVNENHPDCRP